MSKEEKKFAENWGVECSSCGQLPTVDVVSSEDNVEHSFGLCGPCCFGTAKALDSDNWND